MLNVLCNFSTSLNDDIDSLEKNCRWLKINFFSSKKTSQTTCFRLNFRNVNFDEHLNLIFPLSVKYLFNVTEEMNLNRYFNLLGCLSINSSVCLSICLFLCPNTPIPEVLSQNVCNKKCLVYATSEKYAFMFTPSPLGSMR